VLAVAVIVEAQQPAKVPLLAWALPCVSLVS
jgi:hypothetical protein